MSRSFAAKLVTFLVASLLVVFAILGYLNIRLHRHSIEAITLLSADRVGDVIKRNTSFYMMRNDREGLYHIINTMANEPGMVKVRIFNRDGRISFSTDSREVNTYVNKSGEACYGCHAQSKPLTHLNRPDRFRIYQVEGERVLGIITPINNSASCANAECHAHPPDQKVLGVLDTNLSLAAADREEARNARQLMASSAIAAILISMLTGAFVWYYVQRRVSRIRRATDHLGAGDLGYQIIDGSRDELGDLARSFNRMSSQLQEANDEITSWTRTLEVRVDQKTAELKSANEQMLQAEKLASLGKMSAVVAHEINNPLSGILTYARLMRKWLDRDEPIERRAAEMRESLILIESESRRCGEIVKNLLTFARAAPMNLQPVNINAIVGQCLKLVDHQLELGNITLDLKLIEDIPNVQGDTGQLEQLILALTINAIEAMPREGTLHLATSTSDDRSKVTAIVEDDGMGIPEELLPRLFEPFVTTKENHGVGLGLAISKSIVERHRGTIEVHSQLGRGTRFTITLPAVSASAISATEGDDAGALQPAIEVNS